jgi:CO/xanthine dehydrogenase Mo-binding subunit
MYGIGNTSQRNPASVTLEYLPELDRLRINAAAVDMGQNPSRALVGFVAKRLAVSPTSLIWIVGDTLTSPDSGKTSASRTVHFLGSALERCCQLLLDEVRQRLTACVSRPVAWTGDGFAVTAGRDGAPAERWSTLQAFRRVAPTEAATATYDPPIGERSGVHYPTYAVGACVAEIVLDTETNMPMVRRVRSVHEVGELIDPIGAEQQVHGGIGMGVSLALGDPRSPLGSICSAAEMPDMEVVLLEGSGGDVTLRGLGEPAIVGVPAAVHGGYLAARDNTTADDVGRSLSPLQSWSIAHCDDGATVEVSAEPTLEQPKLGGCTGVTE